MGKKFLSLLLATALVSTTLLTGCGSEAETQKQTETSDTKKGAKDNKAILVVSFGTSYNNSRNITIGGIESAIAEAHPDYQLRNAFTSQIIIDKLAKRDGIKIDNVKEALKRAEDDGITELVIQPTHLMNGLEYTDLKEEVEKNKDKFSKITLGAPLLSSDEDFSNVANAITEMTKAYDDGETAICFMGHGTTADSNKIYAELNDKLHEEGHENCYVGTVEATPSCEDVINEIKSHGGYKKVVLRPLMVVAGDHANNDMADPEDPESWYSQFTKAGFEVTPVLKGLGQEWEIEKLYVDHTNAAIEKLGK